MTKQRRTEITTPEPGILDHAREFVELVCREAPDAYQSLLADPHFQRLLENRQAFNHGKLFAWAEFTVFRTEFRNRFPEADNQACINAFSKLFLKNDISISNLVTAIEGWPTGEAFMLQRGDAADR